MLEPGFQFISNVDSSRRYSTAEAVDPTASSLRQELTESPSQFFAVDSELYAGRQRDAGMEHRPQIEIRGLGLKPDGATDEDLGIQFSADSGHPPIGHVISGSYTNEGVLVRLEGLHRTLPGGLHAAVTVAGRAVGPQECEAPLGCNRTQVGTVVAPITVYEDHSRLVSNAQKIIVLGENLPESCPSNIIVTSTFAGEELAIVSGLLKPDLDFELQNCTSRQFVLVLRPGRSWGLPGYPVRIHQYSDSERLGQVLAVLLPPFRGSVSTSDGELSNVAREFSLFGSGLVPEGIEESDICLLYTSPSPRDS
eukprot:TRINITY_DN50219_c0_g1_i2.p1 TRINITY_DN50219_c0_g1~~TRINITY_DN50219_c0_g1_i2.p1  ORF type:complete len:309 (+),score=56.26 TRINITY_DN50219_c0_g1_i2:808-1734(+)